MTKESIAIEIIQGKAVVLSKMTLHLCALANENGLVTYAKADLDKVSLEDKRAELVNWATVRWLKELHLKSSADHPRPVRT